MLTQQCTGEMCGSAAADLDDDWWGMEDFVRVLQETRVRTAGQQLFLPDALGNKGFLSGTSALDLFPWQKILAGQGYLDNLQERPKLSIGKSELRSPILGDSQLMRSWDVDTILGRLTSLAAFWSGLKFHTIPNLTDVLVPIFMSRLEDMSPDVLSHLTRSRSSESRLLYIYHVSKNEVEKRPPNSPFGRSISTMG